MLIVVEYYVQRQFDLVGAQADKEAYVGLSSSFYFYLTLALTLSLFRCWFISIYHAGWFVR
jgi:hypothetical protein